MKTSILPQSFYSRDTAQVARDLIGKVIVRELPQGMLAGMIVETESYGYADDPASHTYKGLTERNAAMFGPVGHAYVYFIYGNHFCFDVVAHDPEVSAGGVLIRAMEPVLGVEHMLMLRNKTNSCEIGNGPGKLAQALAITKEHDHMNLMQQGPVYLVEGFQVLNSDIIVSTRIGISKAVDKPWRFYLRGNKHVSKS